MPLYSLSYFVPAHSGVQCPSSAARRCDSLSPLFTRLPNLPRPAAVDPQPCGNPDVAEAPSDHGQRPRGRGCRHSHDVGQYVGDDPCCLAAVVDALIEPTCAAQGFADADAEPVRGLLLQGRTGERWRLANGGDRRCGLSQATGPTASRAFRMRYTAAAVAASRPRPSCPGGLPSSPESAARNSAPLDVNISTPTVQYCRGRKALISDSCSPAA